MMDKSFIQRFFTYKKQHIYVVALGFILCVGLFVRLHRSHEFFPLEKDQVDDLLTIHSIWETIHSGNFVNLELQGQEGTYSDQLGVKNKNPIYHGVLYYYLLLPAAVISQFQPYGVVLFFIGIGLLCVCLLYIAGIVVFGNRVIGFVASCLGATSFWLSAYSRWIWPSSILMSFFSLVSLISLFLITQGRVGWWYVFAISSAFGSQIHASGYVPLVYYSLLLLAARPRLPNGWKKRVLLLCCFVIPLLPSVLYEISSDWNMTRTSSDIIATAITVLPSLGSSLAMFITDSLGLSALPARLAVPLQHFLETQQLLIFWCVVVSVVIGVRYVSIKQRELKFHNQFMFWWWMLFLPIPLVIRFFYEMPNKEARTNNTLFALPLFLLCLGALLVWLWNKKPALYRLCSIVLSVGYVVINISAMSATLWNVGTFEWGQGELRTIANTIPQWTEGKPYHLDVRRYPKDLFLRDLDYGIVYLLNISGGQLPETFNDQVYWGRPRDPIALRGGEAYMRIVVMANDLALTEKPPGDAHLLVQTPLYAIYRSTY